MALEERKVELAGCKGSLVACQSQVVGLQGELADSTSLVEKLKKNVADIKKQVTKWQQIASDAEAYAKRLLAAAEAKVSCEEYNAENARLTDEFVSSFNNSVRRKILRPDDSGNPGATEVVPKTPAAPADSSDKRGQGSDSGSAPQR